MKRTITFYDFCDAFRDMGRNDSYSYDAKRLLFEYFDDLDEQCDIETELDVIAICCDFDEEHWSDIAENYSIDLSDCEEDDEKQEAVADYINYHGFGIVGFVGEDIVYQAF